MNYRHRSFSLLVLIFNAALVIAQPTSDLSWIRINQLGYKPESIKVAVLCSKENITVRSFQIIDAGTGKIVFENTSGKSYGGYGPFQQTYRLNFSAFNKSGMFRIKAGETLSPPFPIGADVYKGTADFSLQYMRQQRSGYNPFLKDSCHTQDGYTVYGPMPDSTHLDVSGGWHDATDYLQYAATSANATYHLLAAWRDFPEVFGDQHQANGMTGKNSIADVMDEARWGLDWLIKMHPRPDWMFNQLADDRDHVGFRLPANDKANYGKGKERPVYFITGEPQRLSKYKNKTTGTSSSAGKFSSAFSLGYQLLKKEDASYANTLKEKSFSAYAFAFRKQGNTQTASYLSPYIYAEDNWVDDLELAAAQQFPLTDDTQFIKTSFGYAQQEKLSPWLGKDTASHYQWYPFINIGHYELAKVSETKIKNQLIAFYKEGIEQILHKGKQNAFLRGVPFIWCSNNLQTSFAIQCYWYRELSGDETYAELEQATFDWLFGCNPWGTSMVVGLPSTGDFPDDAHSSLTILHGYQTLGSLVDGPVYGSIFKQQRGVTLVHGDEYAAFQSNLVVYHDDYGDYATNEPTMDGTASLIYLLAAAESKKSALKKKALTDRFGAIIRGDTPKKEIALVFTGDQFGDGAKHILQTLNQEKVRASFFLTGNFYRHPGFSDDIRKLKKAGHYPGAHSDRHLLYCDWTKRDSLLVTREQFKADLEANYSEMKKFGIQRKDAPYFLPPYEWYNDSIVSWTRQMGLTLINFSPGTISHADYTTPDLKNYRNSEEIFQSIISYEKKNGMNGFILLMHIGVDPARKDKFYLRLEAVIKELKSKGYRFLRIDDLLEEK